MEMKSYQRKVIADLTRYLAILNECHNYKTAFRSFWQEKSAPSLGSYQDILPVSRISVLRCQQVAEKPLLPAMPFVLFLTRFLFQRQKLWYGLYLLTLS